MKKILFWFFVFLLSWFSAFASSWSWVISTFSWFTDFPKYENEVEIIQIPYMSGATHYANYSDFMNITNSELLNIRYLLIFLLFFIVSFWTYFILNSIILLWKK